MAARIDIAILHEIVRIIQERAQVPEKVVIRAKQYLITYLDDHRQRLEEAMRRRDADRLGMLFGQLPGRIKYQMMRGVRGKAIAAKPPAKALAKAPPKPPAKALAKAPPKPSAKPLSRPPAKPSAAPAAKTGPKASASKAVAKSRPKAPSKPKAKSAARVTGKRRARA